MWHIPPRRCPRTLLETKPLHSFATHSRTRQSDNLRRPMKLLRITVCLAALSSSAVASIPVGRGEIALDAEAMVTYDSNVQGRQKSDDDVYGTFAPRISYTSSSDFCLP